MIFRRKFNFGIVYEDVTEYRNPYSPKTKDEVFNDVTQVDIHTGDHVIMAIPSGKEKTVEVIESDDYVTLLQIHEQFPDLLKHVVIPKTEIKNITFFQKIINGHVYGDMIKDEQNNNILLCKTEEPEIYPAGWSPETKVSDELPPES